MTSDPHFQFFLVRIIIIIIIIIIIKYFGFIALYILSRPRYLIFFYLFFDVFLLNIFILHFLLCILG